MFNEPHTVWRAEVGGNETGAKNFTYYHVQIEFVVDGYPGIKKHYQRWDEYFMSEAEAYEFIRNFKNGRIRQAWIDKVEVVKTRHKYFDKPHNIGE